MDDHIDLKHIHSQRLMTLTNAALDKIIMYSGKRYI